MVVNKLEPLSNRKTNKKYRLNVTPVIGNWINHTVVKTCECVCV